MAAQRYICNPSVSALDVCLSFRQACVPSESDARIFLVGDGDNAVFGHEKIVRFVRLEIHKIVR